MSMKQLTGLNAIITGASRGLGVYIAKALAEKGVNLVLIARSAKALVEVQEEILSYDVKVVFIPADLTDAGNFKTLVEEAELKLGPTDILINNAGIELTAPYEDFPEEIIRSTINLNLLAPMLLTRAVLPGMLERGRGHIVNISSLAGKAGFPFETPYSASKGGLITFSHTLRAELINQPVGVSVICPGFVGEAGMYADKEHISGPAPKLMTPTTPEKVAKAVVRAIQYDIAELIVNPLPMRPLAGLKELVPGITPYLHKMIGTFDFARNRAEKVKSEK
ncbi:MAG: SDR family NAD(P)-dependent oxidoreductase [Balneolaceae bacterium]|nr:MAG: SDR family NAD(P)-dependent oxidoreductase [Balneolaceae bacterium]